MTLRDTRDRKELYSCKSIINELMFCMTATQGMRLEALEGQVDLARQPSNFHWLKTVARDADTFQFHGPDWIDQHLYALPQTTKKLSKMPSTRHSRDIRLGTFYHKKVCRRCSCGRANGLLDHCRGRGEITAFPNSNAI